MNLLVAATTFLFVGLASAQGPGALVRPLGPPYDVPRPGGPGGLTRPGGSSDEVSRPGGPGGLTGPGVPSVNVPDGLTRPFGPPDDVTGGLARPFGPPDEVTGVLTRSGGPPDFSVKVPGLPHSHHWGRPVSFKKRGPPSPLHAFPSCQQMDLAIRDTHEGS